MLQEKMFQTIEDWKKSGLKKVHFVKKRWYHDSQIQLLD